MRFLAAMEKVEVGVPLVVRFGGTNAEEGRALLQGTRLMTAETLSEAARKAIEAAGGTVTE